MAVRAPVSFVLPPLLGIHVVHAAIATADLALASGQLPPAAGAALTGV